MYVATLKNSTLDASYLTKRGFHWYAFDTDNGRFFDLSASEPGGVGAEHGGLVPSQPSFQAVDLRWINPTGDIYRYDISGGQNERIGRPDYQRPYVYPGQFMWVDRRGRLYFTAGNDKSAYYGAPYDPAWFSITCRCMIRRTVLARCRTGRCTTARHRCRPVLSRRGRVLSLGQYRPHHKFEEAGPTWQYVGNIGQESSKQLGYTWVFHVRGDKKKIYIVTTNGHLYQFGLSTGAATFVGDLKRMEPELATKQFLYGHNAWDANGKFFFAAFN